MPHDSGNPPIAPLAPDEAAYQTEHDAAHDAFVRTQIEQRLHSLFRLAGDGASVQQLRQMIIDYRRGQQP